MNDLNERARALIDTAKSQGGLTPERRARLTESITAATAAGAALAGTSSASAAAPAAVSLLKLGVVGILSVGVGVGGTWAARRVVSGPPREAAPVTSLGTAPSPSAARPAPLTPPEPPPGPMAQVEAIAGPGDAPPAPPTPGPARAARPTPAVEHPAPAPVVAPVEPTPPARQPPGRVVDEDSTAEEVHALSQATEALRTREYERALTLARGVRLRFPRGVLHAELTLVEVDALCGLARVDEARSLADALTAAERTALIVDRLGRSCAAAGTR